MDAEGVERSVVLAGGAWILLPQGESRNPWKLECLRAAWGFALLSEEFQEGAGPQGRCSWLEALSSGGVDIFTDFHPQVRGSPWLKSECRRLTERIPQGGTRGGQGSPLPPSPLVPWTSVEWTNRLRSHFPLLVGMNVQIRN